MYQYAAVFPKIDMGTLAIGRGLPRRLFTRFGKGISADFFTVTTVFRRQPAGTVTGCVGTG
jgi:hypothetical protein